MCTKAERHAAARNHGACCAAGAAGRLCLSLPYTSIVFGERKDGIADSEPRYLGAIRATWGCCGSGVGCPGESLRHSGMRNLAQARNDNGLIPDDLRHLARRRSVAAALGANDAVDNGHADAGQVAELHALKNVLAGRMLCLVHDYEVG